MGKKVADARSCTEPVVPVEAVTTESGALTTPNPRARSHNWPIIVGVSRQILSVMRARRGKVQPYDRQKGKAAILLEGAIAHELGPLLSLVKFYFTRDPDADFNRTHDETSGLLFTRYVNDPALRFAAVNLWAIYDTQFFKGWFGSDVSISERHNALIALTSLTDVMLAEFEDAIEGLARAAGVDEKPPIEATGELVRSEPVVDDAAVPDVEEPLGPAKASEPAEAPDTSVALEVASNAGNDGTAKMPVVVIGLKDGTITFDGKTYARVNIAACEALEKVINGRGNPVGLTSGGVKANRIIEKLPEEIKVRLRSIPGNKGYVFDISPAS